MTIQYHGDSCVRLTGKHGPQEFTVLVDPYDAKATGLKPLRPSSVDLVLSTSGDLPSFSEGPYVVSGPGEYEVRGVSVQGFPFHGRTVYRIVAEDIVLAHLGNVAAPLDDALVDRLDDVDVLLVPIGGAPAAAQPSVLTAKSAAATIERLEPRVVIPMQYAIAGSELPFERADAFCKAMGCSEKDAEDKFKITKKDLPSEGMVVRMVQVT